MAWQRKKTVRLEVDLSGATEPIIVNYRELVEKVTASRGDNDYTPPSSPLLGAQKSQQGLQLLDIRRKAKSWDIPDFRPLAEGYEEDSFIDDSEMFEESMTDSLKEIGYKIRSASDSDGSEIEFETPTNCNLLTAGTMKKPTTAKSVTLKTKVKVKTKAKAKPKKDAGRLNTKRNLVSKSTAISRIADEWSECLQAISQNSALELTTLPLTPPALQPQPQLQLQTLCAAAEVSGKGTRKRKFDGARSSSSSSSSSEQLGACACTCSHPLGSPPTLIPPSAATQPSRPIITVDLCDSPTSKGSSHVKEDSEEDKDKDGDCGEEGQNFRPASSEPDAFEGSVVATNQPASAPANSLQCSSASRAPTSISSPDEYFFSTAAILNASCSSGLGISLSTQASSSSGYSTARECPIGLNALCIQTQHSEGPKHALSNKVPQLTPSVISLLEQLLANPSTKNKWWTETRDDLLLKLCEECRRLPPVDRMFVYERLATHWGISSKTVSRRLSRLRAYCDKQPVKESLHRLHSLLTKESQNKRPGGDLLSSECIEALLAVIRAKWRQVERHPPRKGDVAGTLADFVQRDLLALWASGGPGEPVGPGLPAPAAAATAPAPAICSNDAYSAAATTIAVELHRLENEQGRKPAAAFVSPDAAAAAVGLVAPAANRPGPLGSRSGALKRPKKKVIKKTAVVLAPASCTVSTEP